MLRKVLAFGQVAPPGSSACKTTTSIRTTPSLIKVAAIHQCISCISVLRDLLTSFLRSMCASSESMLGSKSIFNSVHLRWSSGKAAALRLASSSVAEASYPPADDERLAIDDGSER